MFKKFLAATLVMVHVMTYSLPASFAAVVTDADGNVVGSSENGQPITLTGGNYNLAGADIAAGESLNLIVNGGTANFNIIDNHATNWAGTLNLDGLAMFYNPLGFVITETFQANIDGGAILSTLGGQMTNGLGQFALGANDPASIINNGTFTATPGSFVAFIGSAVQNNGTVNAELGGIGIGVGDKVTLDITGGSRLISVTVDEAVSAPVYDVNGNKINDGISNAGALQAGGGAVILSAKAVEQIFDNVINHTGLIEANSIASVNGRIILDGGDKGITSVTGTLNAKGDDLGEKGGLIEVLGDKVGLFAGATVDASGYNGGGTVLIGGDYQGLGEARTASQTYVDKWADIKADAILEGDGGKIIVWADETTQAYGTFSARGGQLEGDGGLIETSGKEYLDITGIGIDASAPNGQGGTWLLDPFNTTITAATTSNNSGAPAFTPTANNSEIAVGLINGQIDAGIDVVIGTGAAGSQTGNIVLDAAATIAKAAGGNATLTLNAAGGITLNGVIGATVGFLNVVLNAANGNININNTVNTNGGTFSATTTGNDNINMGNANSDLNTAGGAVSIISGGDFNMTNNGASILTSGGQIDATAFDHIEARNINTGAGAINLTASTGSMNIGGTINTTSGNITANAADNLTLNSAVLITTTGGNFIANANTDADATGTFQQGAGGSTINTAAGNIDISGKNVALDGALITTGAGDISLTATNGDVDLTQTLNTQAGDINLNADNGVRLNGANADIATTGGNININANTDGDADGDFTQNSGASSIATAGGNVSITAQDFILSGTTNAGAGDVSLLGAQAGSTYLVGTGSSSGFTGAITGAELQGVTASDVTIGGSNVAGITVRGITATNSNNAGTTHINAGAAAGNVTFDTTASTFNALDVNAGNNVNFNTSVSTDAGNMTVNADSDLSGAGDLNIAGGVVLDTAGNDFTATGENVNVAGSVQTGTPENGGDITITSGNMITVTGTGSLLTALGAGGIVTIGSGVDLQAGSSVIAGAGNITLNSVGPVLDVIINTNIISGTSIFISALRDIIVQALVQTTNAADGNITLRADSDDDGVGGVWVQAAGQVDAAQNVNLIGSDLFAIAGTQESIQIDADGANNQVQALEDITLQTAGFAPAGSDMNINGIVNGLGAGSTVTVNSVGNINSTDNGVSELRGDNLSLTAVEGIDIESAVDTVAFNNTTSGNVAIQNFGSLTVTGAANGGSGTTSIVTASPLTIAANLIQNGTINLTAGESGAAGDDLTVNGGVTVQSVLGDVNLNAGDNVTLNAASTVQSDAGSVNVNAGSGDMDGNGNINLAGAVSALSNVVLNALQGGVTQTTGSVAANSLQFSAENSVALANAGNNYANVTGSSSTGSINLGNSAAAASIDNLTTSGQDITYNHSGAGSVTVDGTVDSGNAGSANGGNITINNLGGSLTVTNSAVLTSMMGAGGVLSVSNATIDGGATIVLGQGNITLNGGGLDLIINVPIISGTSIFLSALRDIIVQALVQTTNAADGNITLRADSDNDGEGGVWVQAAGEVDAAQNIDIMGSNLFAIPGTLESIQIDADGGNNQVHTQNGGTIDLHTTGFAPAGSDMNLNGIVFTGGLLRVDSVGNINTTNDGNVELFSNELKLTAVEGIDAEIDATTAAYLNSTSGDVRLEDLSGGLTIGTVDGLVGGTNNGGATTIETHSPLTINANVASAGNVNLHAFGNNAGDDLTIGSGVTVSSVTGSILMTAGQDIITEANSVVTVNGTNTITAAAGEDFTNAVIDGDGQQNGSLIMDGTSAFRSQDGNITVDAKESARVAEINADSDNDGTRGNVSITARDGFISDRNGASTNVTADDLTLNAELGIGDSTVADDDELETDVNTVDSFNGTSGHVNIVEVAAGGDLDIVSAVQDGDGDHNIRTTNGTLEVLAGGSGVSSKNGETTLLAQDNDNSGNDHLLINNTVSSTGDGVTLNSGKINLDSHNDVRFSVDGDVTSTNGEIEVDATDFLTMSDDGVGVTILDAGTGAIDLDAGLDINLASVKTTSTNNQAVVIVSRGGRIIDAGDTDGFNVRTGAIAEDPSIFDGGLLLSAFNGIGVNTDAFGGLETKVGNLAAITGSDDIQVFNTGAMNITDISDPDALTSLGFAGAGLVSGATIQGGDPSAFIFITTASPMVVSSAVTNFAGGDITLYALGGLTTDTMDINANVQSIGGNGDIRLASGSSMTMGPNVQVSTQGDGVTSGTGQVFIGAGYDVTGKAANEPVTPGATLFLPSSSLFDTVGNSAANLTMDESSTVWTENGNILVDVQNDFFVGRVDADGNASTGITDNLRGDVTAFARNGSILDSEVPDLVSTNLDFVADALTMFANGTIGLPPNFIETQANSITTYSNGSQFINNIGDVIINLLSTQGSIFFGATGDILLGTAHAPTGEVTLTSGRNILSISTDLLHIDAATAIRLTAAGVVGGPTAPINTEFNSPDGGTLFLNIQGSNAGVSGVVRGNFGESSVQFDNLPPGLVFLNNVAIGGATLEQFNSAITDMFAEIGRFNNRTPVDFPGYNNTSIDNFAPFAPSINTNALDTLPAFYQPLVPPTVVPIPGEAAAEEQKKQPQPAVEGPRRTPAPQTQGQQPPTIVPIPADATPTLQPDVENKGQ